MHPILARLEGVGWLSSRWEDIDTRVEGRPPRRYYRLTAEGVVAAGAALARTSRRTAPTVLRPVGGES